MIDPQSLTTVDIRHRSHFTIGPFHIQELHLEGLAKTKCLHGGIL